jgi:hypothetical protein
MAQTIRLTVTPDLEKALQILRESTLGVLNTTEIVKMAIGGFAHLKAATVKDKNISMKELDKSSALLFFEWAKEDGSLDLDNISPNAIKKPFTKEPYVSNC